MRLPPGAVHQAAAPPPPSTPEPEDEKPAPKPKDPLAALPPSKMVMDAWKRLYSNTPATQFKEVCVEGLWNGADVPKSPNNEVWRGSLLALRLSLSAMQARLL